MIPTADQVWEMYAEDKLQEAYEYANVTGCTALLSTEHAHTHILQSIPKKSDKLFDIMEKDIAFQKMYDYNESGLADIEHSLANFREDEQEQLNADEIDFTPYEGTYEKLSVPAWKVYSDIITKRLEEK